MPKDTQQVNSRVWVWIQAPELMILSIKLKLHFYIFHSWPWLSRSGARNKKKIHVQSFTFMYFFLFPSLLSWAPSCWVTVLIHHPLNQLIPFVLKLQYVFKFMYSLTCSPRQLGTSQIFCNPHQFIEISMHFL